MSTEVIGIASITNVGGRVCLDALYDKAMSENVSIQAIMLQADEQELLQAIMNQDWDITAKLILDVIERLKRAGATFVIIPSNTPHYAYAKISKASPLPLLNLITLCADECEQRKYKKVVIMGTKLTMNGALYHDSLKERGIESIKPDEETQMLISQLIFDVILKGKKNELLERKIIENILKLGADAAILGCTELPFVFNEDNMKLPAIDTTRLLAIAAYNKVTTPSFSLKAKL